MCFNEEWYDHQIPRKAQERAGNIRSNWSLYSMYNLKKTFESVSLEYSRRGEDLIVVENEIKKINTLIFSFSM